MGATLYIGAGILVLLVLVILFGLFRGQPKGMPTEVLRLREAILHARQQQATAEEMHVLERDLLAQILDGAPSGSVAHRLSRRMQVVIAFFIAGVTVGGYLLVGRPDAMEVADWQTAATAAGVGPIDQGEAKDAPHGMSFDQIRQSAAALAQKLAKSPDDGSGFATLARSYNVLGQFKAAVDAYRKAVALMPKDAQLLVDYADALGMLQDKKLAGEPEKLIEQALAMEPDNLKGLSLKASLAFERKQYDVAASLWSKALSKSPADSDFAAQMRANLKDVESLSGKSIQIPQGLPPLAMESAGDSRPVGSPAASGNTATISGEVVLSADLQGKVSPEDTLFIFAKPVTGNATPLAIVKKQVKDLPYHFTLKDSDAMAPTLLLSSASQVIITARVSRHNDAKAQPGDLQGQSTVVKVGEEKVAVRIDKQL